MCRQQTWAGKDCGNDGVFTQGSRRCNHTLPGQCVKGTQFGDGRYNCLDRSDEHPYKALADSVVNVTALVVCREGSSDEGLSCEGKLSLIHI